MQIEFAQVRPTGSAPLWLAFDSAKTDSFTARIAAGQHTFDEVTRFIRRYFASVPQSEFIDIGAHFGTYALAVAELGTDVLAVEALPDNYVILSEAARKNGFRNLRCLHLAATDHTGVATVSGQSAWGHIAETGIAVPALPVDNLPLAFPLRGLLKIDVEGHEYPVLKGAERTIAENHGLDVIVEIFPGHQRSLAFLEQLGFRCYMLKLDSLILSSSDAFQEQQVTDYFCTRRNINAEFAGTPVIARTLDLSLRLIGAEATAQAVDHRIEIARRLKFAPTPIRNSSAVAEILARLRDDSDAGVRDAAAWSHPPNG